MDLRSEVAGVAGGRWGCRGGSAGKEGEMDRRFLRKCSEEERLRKHSESG